MGWQLHPGVEAAHIFAAMILKLSCSSDDLAWLTPFLMHNRFLAFFYLVAMEMVVAIAIGLATAGSALLDNFTEEEAYWDTDRILGLLSSICLSIFAFLLFIEYYFEDDDESDEDSSQEPIEVGVMTKRDPDYSIAVPGVASWGVEDVVKWWKTSLPAMAQEQLSFIEDCEIHGKDLLRMDEEMLMEVGMKKLMAKKVMNEIDKLVDADPRSGYTPHWPPNESNVENPLDDPLLSHQQSEKSSGKSSKFTPLRVISVSLLGSFDDMAIQASVLKGGDLYWYQLAIGIGLGACCVVGICLFLTSFESIRNCLEKLPVFLIIACFAAYSFICTFI